MNVADTLEFLAGTWRVERIITDHRFGASGQFTGIAIFRPDVISTNDILLFDEEGEMNWESYCGRSRRSLNIVRASSSGVIVNFADGRRFIDLDLRKGNSFAQHSCRDDLYEVTTIAQSDTTVEERWRVTGPQKDYEALSTWSRQRPTAE